MMVARLPKIRTATLILGCATLCVFAKAQTPPQQESPASSADRPIPDVVAMMHDVEINQRKAEAVKKDYLYHSVETQQQLDSHGQVKKTVVNEYDHYWSNGVPVWRLVSKNGKPLSPEETKHEDERIDKDVAKARERRDKADAQGKQTDAMGEQEITVSRLLELGSFTNARRVQQNGRDTIAVDFTGNPKAKTQNRAEDAVRDLQGTAWIDERDRMLVRVEGHFVDSFKVGGGLLVDIKKGTGFTFEQTKVNDEVWLPARIDAQGSLRALLFVSFSGKVHVTESGYRKFRTTSTILPAETQADDPQVHHGPIQP
jgi:hypothetical protein